MNKKLTLPLLLCVACTFSISQKAIGQDSEKQKILQVLKTEQDSYVNKNKQAWSNTWVHSDKVRMTAFSSSWFYEGIGWDSISANRAEHFSTPVKKEQNKVVRSDFDVMIKGPLAIVDFVQKDSLLSTNQTAVLEKQGKEWKIIRMMSLAKDSFTANDQNVEAAINTQGYLLLRMKKVDEAIKVFALNTQLFPTAWNVWDSLAEAYMIKGENDIATGYYKKSMELNADNDNGQKMLDILAKK
jgi:tetratricopeptide (TPR) repeat protein